MLGDVAHGVGSVVGVKGCIMILLGLDEVDNNNYFESFGCAKLCRGIYCYCVAEVNYICCVSPAYGSIWKQILLP